MSIMQGWNDYRPSKGALAWAAVGASVLTMIVGFTWGGWVTGGTADTMAAQARQDAQEQLVASICVDRFVTAPDAIQNLQALKDESSWQQDGYIEDGGWVNIEALEEQVAGAADLCADRLVAMEQIPLRNAEPGAAEAGSATVGG